MLPINNSEVIPGSSALLNEANWNPLISFIPFNFLQNLLNYPQTDPAQLTEKFDVVAMFADISGFTSLSDKLAASGQAGVEELSNLLNAYFTDMISLIENYGGIVSEFGGDALTVLFPIQNVVGKVEVTQRAIQCALDMQDTITRKYKNLTTLAGTFSLTMEAGLASGPVYCATVGRVSHSLKPVITGQVLERCAQAEHQAERGTIVLEQEVARLVEDIIASQPVSEGFVRVTGLKTTVSPAPLPEVIALPDDLQATLQQFLHPSIAARLQTDQLDFINELRRVTTLFVKFGDFDCDRDPGQLERLRFYLTGVLNIVEQHAGYLMQVDVGDKGSKFIVFFGAPISHKDNYERALRCALELQQWSRQQEVNIRAGINSGKVYCGLIGSTRRRTYAAIGTAINLAAHLMETAQKDQILVSSQLVEATREHFTWQALPAVRLKGRAEPFEISQLLEVVQAGTGPTRPKNGPVVGRVREQDQLREKLAALKQSQPAAVIIEGEPGIGKTYLINTFLGEPALKECTVLTSSAEVVEQSNAYYCWRGLINQLLDLNQQLDSTTLQTRIMAAVAGEARLVQLAPLFNTLMPNLNLPDNELTGQLSGKLRADHLNELIIGLLRKNIQPERPVVLVIEDAQWLDSASWGLTALVAQQLPTLLIMSTRPLGEPLPAEYKQLTRLPHAMVLNLQTLSAEDIVGLVCQSLGVDSLPELIGSLILEKSEGHPFFSVELAYALRDSELIRIENGQCQLTAQPAELETLILPDTIEATITSRIDRLPPAEQLVLKIGSVIGRVFGFQTLWETHPIENERPHLRHYLKDLETLEITPLEQPEPELAYVFKHAITQEVAYNLMLFSQRSELHRLVAQWFEEHYAADPSPVYSTLAYHWVRAKNEVKAVEYLDKAGGQALYNGAYQEALYFYSEVLKRAASVQATPEQKARWTYQLSQAYGGLGQMAECWQNLEEALKILGWKLPQNRRELLLNIAAQGVIQLGHRLLGLRWFQVKAGTPASTIERITLSTTIFDELLEKYVLGNETLPGINTTLCSINQGEKLEPTKYLADAYMGGSFTTALVPLFKLARFYENRSDELAYLLEGDWLGQAHVARTRIIYTLNVGRFEQGERSAKLALDLYNQLGLKRETVVVNTLLAYAFYYQGKYEQGYQLYHQIYQIARMIKNGQIQLWTLLGQAGCLLGQGRLEETEKLIEEASGLLAPEMSSLDRAWFYSCQLTLNMRRDHWQEAYGQANELAKLMQSSLRRSLSSVQGYRTTAEVYLALWERQGELKIGDSEELRQKARLAIRTLTRFGRIVPFGSIYARLYQGWFEWLNGQPARARAHWQASLSLAEQMNVPYEQALVHYEIGRHLPKSDALRPAHLASAARLFRQVGASWELERLEHLK